MSVSRLLVGDDGSSAAAAARSWAERLAAVIAGDVSVVRVEVDHGDSVAVGLLAGRATTWPT